MPKFFVNKNAISDVNVMLTGDDINHIMKVLRMVKGDTLEVSDGEGNDYIIKITEMNKHAITGEIIERHSEEIQNINVTLFQSLPKSDKMDTIIQKCTELGISKIIPFKSERTVVNINDGKAESKKLERWQKIAKEACKQCGRSSIPEVEKIYDFKQVLNVITEYDVCLLAYEKEKTSLKKILRDNGNYKNIAIVIGPEGGFSEIEVKEALNSGAISVSLGNRILRTETAGMALLCITMYELGEWNNE